MAENVNLEAVQAGLKSVKVLRSCVRDLFRSLADGSSNIAGGAAGQALGQDEVRVKTEGTAGPVAADAWEKGFLSELQVSVGNINNRIRELESACTLLAHPSVQVNVTLGNSALLGQDPGYERTPIYSSMLSSYRRSDRMHEYSTHAVAILNQNTLKRSNPVLGAPGYAQVRGRAPGMIYGPRRGLTNGHSMQQVDSFCLHLQRLFNDMNIEVLRPFGSPAVLKITLERVLKAVVLLRGVVIEWVLVKGFHEDFEGDDGKLDIWSESRYRVFRKVTEHANAAMLHFYSPVHADLALKSFVTWLHSYSSLFSKPCKKCETRLQHNMPPTWRDVRNLDVYHDLCRP